jgi:hypothetical protein
MIIHTRIGKLARCTNRNRKKTSGIKLPAKYFGQFVCVISRREYREMLWKIKRLEGRLAKIVKISS